jgi:hypothetical protein
MFRADLSVPCGRQTQCSHQPLYFLYQVSLLCFILTIVMEGVRNNLADKLLKDIPETSAFSQMVKEDTLPSEVTMSSAMYWDICYIILKDKKLTRRMCADRIDHLVWEMNSSFDFPPYICINQVQLLSNLNKFDGKKTRLLTAFCEHCGEHGSGEVLTYARLFLATKTPSAHFSDIFWVDHIEELRQSMGDVEAMDAAGQFLAKVKTFLCVEVCVGNFTAMIPTDSVSFYRRATSQGQIYLMYVCSIIVCFISLV